MEGIMIRNGEKYSVAVRTVDKDIAVKVEEYHSFIKNKKVLQLPIIRGVFSFVDSLVLGMKTLMYSASFFAEETEEEKQEREAEERRKAEKRQARGKKPKKELSEEERQAREKKLEDALMTGTMIFSVIAAVALFMVLPYFIVSFLRRVTASETLIALAEGVVRIALFMGYIVLISRMKDIQRTFMYHGAEHKCINCIEHGLELNVENVMKSSREHKRCGTSFLLIVMIVSVIFFLFIRVNSPVLRVVVRLLLIPVIAGVSFEFIRLAGRSENKVVELLSKPGMCLQRLTTKEPDESMAEVAIKAVEAVFDWKKYLNENFGYTYDLTEGEENGRDGSGLHGAAAAAEQP